MLSDAKARAAKPRLKRYRLTDGDGLLLEVRPNGAKSWIMRYQVAGKRRDKTLGKYPSLSLRDARQQAIEARMQLERGENPFAKSTDNYTFGSVGQAFLESKRSQVRQSYYRTIELRFNKYLFPPFSERVIKDISVSDIRDLLLLIGKTRNETARKLYGLLSELFRFAAMRGYIEYDPTQPLKGLIHKDSRNHYPYITDRKILGNVLNLIDQSSASIPVAIELKMLPHVFVRPSELRLARWEEFDFEDNVWKIPAERMKMRRVHWVPLSRQVLVMLSELKTVVGDGGYLFPGQRYGRPHTESILNIALKNLGVGSDITVPHGFRHTASTMLHELGYEHAHIEKQLAHESGNTIAATYNHAEYLEARRKMMQEWSDFLDDLKSTN